MNNSMQLSLTAKRTLFILFTWFLLSFPHYLPFYNSGSVANSFLETVFTLYFFVFNQTLGIVHEGGHGVCYLFHCPTFFTALNGTVFQLLFPLGIAYYYKRQQKMFASYIGIFFLGFSLLYTAWYMSTAYQGPIVLAKNSFLGVDGYHDFYRIFHDLDLLAYASGIATTTKVLSYLLMIGAVFMMGYDAFIKNSSKKRKKWRRKKQLVKRVKV